MVWEWGTRDTVPIAVDNLLENPARYPDVGIMFQIYSVEHSYRLGGESLRETFTICIYASLAAHCFEHSGDFTICHPTMCNRTPCAQVCELP